MTAEIIQFPSSPIKRKYRARRKPAFIKGVPVESPADQFEYLELCKRFLSRDNYREVLCGISDKNYYDHLEPKLKNVVDCYFLFK